MLILPCFGYNFIKNNVILTKIINIIEKWN